MKFATIDTATQRPIIIDTGSGLVINALPPEPGGESNCEFDWPAAGVRIKTTLAFSDVLRSMDVLDADYHALLRGMIESNVVETGL